jgi:hypothetical protein
MAQKTSGEFEKEFLDTLLARTGRDLADWIAALDGYGTQKRSEIIVWLKRVHGFRHMDAALLAGVHANGGKPVYADTADLLENQFARAPGCGPFTMP